MRLGLVFWFVFCINTEKDVCCQSWGEALTLAPTFSPKPLTALSRLSRYVFMSVPLRLERFLSIRILSRTYLRNKTVSSFFEKSDSELLNCSIKPHVTAETRNAEPLCSSPLQPSKWALSLTRYNEPDQSHGIIYRHARSLVSIC